MILIELYTNDYPPILKHTVYVPICPRKNDIIAVRDMDNSTSSTKKYQVADYVEIVSSLTSDMAYPVRVYVEPLFQ